MAPFLAARLPGGIRPVMPYVRDCRIVMDSRGYSKRRFARPDSRRRGQEGQELPGRGPFVSCAHYE